MSRTEALTSWIQLRQLAKALCRYYFKDDSDQPFELTDGQADIFILIFFRLYPRNQVIAPTQYGKSSTVAMALILRSQAYAEPWAIVTGEQSKSMIIMEKVIQHLFDHESLFNKLLLDPTESLDRLRRSRTKENLTWLGGGGIRTFTADSRNRQRVKSALSGFGSPNIVEDEAALLPNDVQAMIMRMLGGHKDNFILKISNPWEPSPNHFYNTWHQSNYNRIFINDEQGLKEDRYTLDFLEEMKGMPFYDILYKCLFPPEDTITEGGYRKLLTTDQINERMIPTSTHLIQYAQGKARLGVDIGRGGNRTVFCIRYDNVSAILERNRDKDLMANVAKIRGYMELYNISPSNISVDDVGVGGGITDRLAELGIVVNAVKEGAKAQESDKFKNMRAEMFWRGAEWVKNGGQLIEDDGFIQLSLINYKEDSDSRLKIEPKADLVKRGIESPDEADAFSLTFATVNEFKAEESFAII